MTNPYDTDTVHEALLRHRQWRACRIIAQYAAGLACVLALLIFVAHIGAAT